MEISLTVPSSWSELSQEQLAFLLDTIVNVQGTNEADKFLSMSDYSAQTRAAIATYCLFRWTGLKVLTPYGDGFLLKHGKTTFVLSAADLAAAIVPLDWIKDLPSDPVRLDCIGDAEAVNADLSGVPFEDYLACENLWQGYQATHDDGCLSDMAGILYRHEGIKPSESQLLGIFYWWAAVKARFSVLFPHFLRPAESAGSGSTPDYDTLRHNVDAQIRALTKGDVTKESQILALDTWRALTELDAQAREYEELNKRMSKKS